MSKGLRLVRSRSKTQANASRPACGLLVVLLWTARVSPLVPVALLLEPPAWLELPYPLKTTQSLSPLRMQEPFHRSSPPRHVDVAHGESSLRTVLMRAENATRVDVLDNCTDGGRICQDMSLIHNTGAFCESLGRPMGLACK